MDKDIFFAQFGHLAQGPGGIKKLRDLILQLAMDGNFSSEGSDRWLFEKLGSIALLDMGQSPKGEFTNKNEVGLPLLGGASDLGDDTPTPSKWTEQPTKICCPNDLVLCVRATIGKTNIADREYCLGRGVAGLRAVKVTKEWLRYWLASRSGDFIKAGKGATFKQIDKKTLTNWEVNYPPLAEQKRIVAKVDELMGLCDELEAQQNEHVALKRDCVASTLHHLTAAAEPDQINTNWSITQNNFQNWFNDPQTVKTLRATILQLAVQGRLGTNDQNETSLHDELQSAIKSQKKKVKADYINEENSAWDDIPENWTKSYIAPAIEELNYGTSKKCDYNVGETNVFRIPNIGRWEIDHNDMKSADFTEKEVLKLQLQPGDILLIRSNGSITLVGSPALIQEQDIDCLYAGYLVRLRLSKSLFDPAFVVRALSAPCVRKEIEGYGRSTSGVKNINSRQIASLELPIPPLAEQHRIVAKVDELMALCDQLEGQINTQSQLTQDLTASLIHHMTAA
ncbi:MAG: restriction endonuclease subunit S [Methylocystaceae bacterium]|nr:restriction endonuclease subunit S [Methylocystaceae bacterium]